MGLSGPLIFCIEQPSSFSRPSEVVCKATAELGVKGGCGKGLQKLKTLVRDVCVKIGLCKAELVQQLVCKNWLV